MPNFVTVKAVTSGTTAVTLVPAPPANVRRIVVTATLNNRDTVVADSRIQILDGATTTVVASDAALAVGGSITARTIALSAIDELLQIDLGAAVTTTELDGSATYYDEAL